MENQNNLVLNEEAIDALRESAKWTMFLSIMGFIGIGFMLIAAVFMSFVMSSIPDMPEEHFSLMSGMKGYISILYVLIAILYFFPVYYLYKYSKETKESLVTGNSEMLSGALVNLKSHHKYLGIMTIVVISLYILMFVGVMIFAASMVRGAM